MAEGGLSFVAVEGGEWAPCRKGLSLYRGVLAWLKGKVRETTRNGNLSVACGEHLLIKGRGMVLLDGSESALSCVKRVGETSFRYAGSFPSSETLTHFALLERGWKGVVHLHPEDLLCELEFLTALPRLKLPPAGTRELYDELLVAPVGRGFLAISHGYFFDLAEILAEVDEI